MNEKHSRTMHRSTILVRILASALSLGNCEICATFYGINQYTQSICAATFCGWQNSIERVYVVRSRPAANTTKQHDDVAWHDPRRHDTPRPKVTKGHHLAAASVGGFWCITSVCGLIGMQQHLSCKQLLQPLQNGIRNQLCSVHQQGRV